MTVAVMMSTKTKPTMLMYSSCAQKQRQFSTDRKQSTNSLTHIISMIATLSPCSMIPFTQAVLGLGVGILSSISLCLAFAFTTV